jgi:TusA-related sulfurtransferase
LIGFGVPEFEAKRYETRLKKGGILISVHADNPDWISRAKTILEKTGAEDVSSASESRVA